MFLIALAVYVLDLIRSITCKSYSNARPLQDLVRSLLVLHFLQILWTFGWPLSLFSRLRFSAYITRDSTNYVQIVVVSIEFSSYFSYMVLIQKNLHDYTYIESYAIYAI